MNLEPFLKSTPIVDWETRDVLALAKTLADGQEPIATAARCFEWVKTQIRHSADHGDQTVTCSASEVLRHGTGMCYAKSHLLAALLRANGIPTGFVYQRLSVDDTGPPFCLHGLNAAFLPGLGWYRMDARGDREGLSTCFDPPHEALAFQPRLAEEKTFPTIWPDPLAVVVDSLRSAATVQELLARLPDWTQDREASS